MKVAVFGGSGFLGSHIADTLTEKDHKVKILSKILLSKHYLFGLMNCCIIILWIFLLFQNIFFTPRYNNRHFH